MALQRWRVAQEHKRIESKAQALQFFLSSIQDPHNPRHCAICLDGAFRECTDGGQWHPTMMSRQLMKETKDLPRHNPELWDAVVKFLFIKRTNKQMRRLLINLSACNCQLDDHVQRYHQMSIQRYKGSDSRIYLEHFESESAEEQFVEVWRTLFANLFLNLCVPIVRSNIKVTSKGSSTSWPHSPKDLIPYGADTLVESTLRWHRFFSDPLLFHMMSGIVVLCRELVIPSLEKYKFMARAIESTRKLLDRALVDFRSHSDLRHSSADLDSRNLGFTGCVFVYQAGDTMQYLRACLFSVVHNEYIEPLYRGCEIKAMQLCSLLLYASSPLRNFWRSPHEFLDTQSLVQFSHALICQFHLLAPSRPPFLVYPDIKEQKSSFFSQEDTSGLPWEVLFFDTLKYCYKDMRCFARGCMNSLRTSGKDFQRCGKCHVATYCGRDCQTASWRDEEQPHKRVCPVIVDLVEKAGGFAMLTRCIHSNDLKYAFRLGQTMVTNLRNAHVEKSETLIVSEWLDAVAIHKGNTVERYEKPLAPGFSDYESLIAELSSLEGAPKAVYLDHTTRLNNPQATGSPGLV